MKTVIIYATKHGTTRKYAEALAETLTGGPAAATAGSPAGTPAAAPHAEVALVDLGKEPSPDLAPHEAVIVGSCVYFGQGSKAVKDFCARNLETLRQKRLGLFLCRWFQGQDTEKVMATTFPPELRAAAAVAAEFGGAIDLPELSLPERLITRAIGVRESVSHYATDPLGDFVRALT